MSIIIQRIKYHCLDDADVALFIARADLIHPLASGNKIYKLAPNLAYAKAHGYTQLLGFGGAFSNHIHALALMAQKYGLESIGIIRGESIYANNPTLQDAQAAGMRLEFVSRHDYKRRADADYLSELQERYRGALIIPEGGSSQLAIQGCAQLAQNINESQNSDVIAVACGTGATLAGIVCGAKQSQKVIGYAVLRDASLSERVDAFIKEEGVVNTNYSIEKADFGGYAKLDKPLLDFIFDYLDKTDILLDPIYTSKMCRKIMLQVEAGKFKKGTQITMIHSGGIQGWRGMKERVIILAGEAHWQKIEAFF